MKLFLILTSSLLLVSQVSAWSTDGEYPFGKMDDTLVTTHRKFIPKASGKLLHALVLAYGIGQREIVELKQRFDYQYTPWMISSASKFYAPFFENGAPYAPSMSKEEYLQERAKIFDNLQPYDLIIIGKLPFSEIPEEIRTRILDRVREGAALLLIAYDGEIPMISGVKLSQSAEAEFLADAIPSLKGIRKYHANLGKGKIFGISYQSSGEPNDFTSRNREALTPFNSDDPLYYDFALAYLGKIIQRIAGTTSNFTVTSQGVVSLPQIPAESTIEFEILDRWGNTLYTSSQIAAPNLQLKLPKTIPGSAELLNLRLLDNKGDVIDYTWSPIQQSNTLSITALTIPKDGFLPDENIQGSIKLPIAQGELSFTLTDEAKRILYKHTMPVSNKEINFDFPVLHRGSHMATLAVEWKKGEVKQDEARVKLYFNTAEKLSNDFTFGIWDTSISNSRVRRIASEVQKQTGVDIFMDVNIMYAPDYAAKTPRMLKEAGLTYACYLTRLVVEIQRGERCNLSGYYDASTKRRTADPVIKKIVEGAKGIGCAFWNFGDENTIALHGKKEHCYCKECQSRFRDYLKEVYGSLEAVNKEYSTSYKTFDGINGLKLEEAATKDQLSNWVDYRLFMEREFTRWHQLILSDVRAIDKDSRCGLEGMSYPANSYTGFNFPQMLPLFDFAAPYFNDRDVHALKYLKGNALKGAWFGSYAGQMNEQYMRQMPWRYLFAGLNSVFWWTAGEPAFSNATIFRPDLQPLAHFRQAAEEINRIKESGIGKLLVSSSLPNSNIAMHYSNNALHAATINPDRTGWDASIRDFSAVLSQSALGYEFLSPDELKKGELKRFKALILPYSQALSAPEAEAIRKFVRDGGLVIADYMPGTMDEHGKFLDQSSLADLFPQNKRLAVHEYGQGTTVLLHDFLTGGAARIGRNDGNGLVAGLLRYLKEYAQIVPLVRVEDESGQFQRADIFMRNDEAYITILAPRTETVAKVKTAGAEASTEDVSTAGNSMIRKLTFPEDIYLYDLTNQGMLLGTGKTFTIKLDPAVGRVLAVRKSAAPTPALKIDKTTIKHGDAVNWTLSSLPSAAIVTVCDPTGKVLQRTREIAGSGRFVASFNDPIGTYTIEAKALTGSESAKINFNLQP